MYYSERFNTITHLIGVVLSIAGLVALIIWSTWQNDIWKIVSFSIYGASLVILYSASTCYHWVYHPDIKRTLQRVDHIAIYLLIAGSYTPFTLVTLRGAWGWTLFGINWALALVGTILELKLGERAEKASMIIYVVMGWLIVIAFYPLIQNLATGGLFWLVAGGIVYSMGIYFYLNDEKIKHGHGIWHLFVLGGSICQFLSVFFYV